MSRNERCRLPWETRAADPGRSPAGLASARVTAASARSPALSAVPAAPAALLPATSVSAAFVPATAVAVPSSVTPAVADESAGIPASAAGKVRATSAAAPGSGISEELMRRNSAPPKPAAITIAAMPTHSAQSNRRAGLIRTGSCPCGFSSLSNAGASVKFFEFEHADALYGQHVALARAGKPAVVNILSSGSVAVQRTCQFIGKRYPLLLRREGYHAARRLDRAFGKPPGTAPLDKERPYAGQEHPAAGGKQVADKAVHFIDHRVIAHRFFFFGVAAGAFGTGAGAHFGLGQPPVNHVNTQHDKRNAQPLPHIEHPSLFERLLLGLDELDEEARQENPEQPDAEQDARTAARRCPSHNRASKGCRRSIR